MAEGDQATEDADKLAEEWGAATEGDAAEGDGGGGTARVLNQNEIDSLLESLGLDGTIRAEAMNVEELLALASALRARLDRELERDG